MKEYPKHKARADGHAAQCKECIYAFNDKYIQENQESIKEYKKQYYTKNKEKEDERARKWREENRENHNKVSRKYKRRWRRENPELTVLEKQRRRAMERELPHDVTEEDLKRISDLFEGKCALTRINCDIHWDHVIPLSTGRGGTILGNLIPLSAELNMSKGSSNVFEWFADNKERFDLSQDNFDRLIEYLAEVNEMTVEEYRDYIYDCHGNVIEVC